MHVVPRRPTGHESNPTSELVHTLTKILAAERHIDIQSAKHARDCTHASRRTHRDRRPLQPAARLHDRERSSGGGPCRTGAGTKDATGRAVSGGPCASAEAAARFSRPLAAQVPMQQRDHGALQAAGGGLMPAPSRRRSPPHLRRGWGWRLVHGAGYLRCGEGIRWVSRVRDVHAWAHLIE